MCTIISNSQTTMVPKFCLSNNKTWDPVSYLQTSKLAFDSSSHQKLLTYEKWSGYWNNLVPQIFSYFNYLIVLEKNRGELDVLDHVFLFNGILGLYEKTFCSLGKVWSLSRSILYVVYVRVLYIIEIIKSVLLL